MNTSLPSTKAISQKQVLHFGPCELRPDTRELLVRGQPQPIRRLVFDLMAYLIAQRPRAVPHAELLRAVWKRAAVSPKMVARAVMEARRVCGDPADDPKLFVSVHGVGYRFVGLVADGPFQPDVVGPDGASPAAEISDLLQRAELAFNARQLEQAQLLAERALSQAVQAQSQAARVRALVLCSTVAMRRGTAAQAAKLAAQAHQIALGEDHPALVALGRVALGHVHLTAGDRGVALRHFAESREALSVPGYEKDLLKCLSRMAVACGDLGQFDTALQTCRRTLSLARKMGLERAIVCERNNEVHFLSLVAEQHELANQLVQARRDYEEGLALIDALLQDLRAAAAQTLQTELVNKAFLLQKLGRTEEALQALSESEAELGEFQPSDGPILAERHQNCCMLRATLLVDLGLHHEALQAVQRSDELAKRVGSNGLPPKLCGMAADIAWRAGMTEEALAWSKRQLRAQTEMQATQAATLVCILEAEMNTDVLQAELDSARGRIATLLQENAELRLRAAVLEGAVPVSPATRLADHEALGAVFAAPHRHARARGLPMCIGLLQLPPAPEPGAVDAAAMVRAFRRAADVLGAQADIAHPAVHVGDGLVAFYIRDAGLARATEVCNAVVEQLQGQSRVSAGMSLEPVWRCTADDAAAAASVEECVQGLVAQAKARVGATWPSPPTSPMAQQAGPGPEARESLGPGGR